MTASQEIRALEVSPVQKVVKACLDVLALKVYPATKVQRVKLDSSVNLECKVLEVILDCQVQRVNEVKQDYQELDCPAQRVMVVFQGKAIVQHGVAQNFDLIFLLQFPWLEG